MFISWHKDQTIHETCAALHRSRENAAHRFTLVQTNLLNHSWENQLSFNSRDWVELFNGTELLLAGLTKCNKSLWEFQLGRLASHFILGQNVIIYKKPQWQCIRHIIPFLFKTLFKLFPYGNQSNLHILSAALGYLVLIDFTSNKVCCMLAEFV